MTPVKRNHEGWVWPKTVLDYAAYHGVAARAQLEEIMDALDVLLGGRGVSVTIQVIPVIGEDRITTEEIIFVTRASPDEMRNESELRQAFYSAMGGVVAHGIHYVQLRLLADPEAPEP
jgi:hypothetical protein